MFFACFFMWQRFLYIWQRAIPPNMGRVSLCSSSSFIIVAEFLGTVAKNKVQKMSQECGIAARQLQLERRADADEEHETLTYTMPSL